MKRQLLWSAAFLLTLAACSQEEILFEEQEPEEQIAEESPIIRPEEESGDESLKVTYIQANGGVETKADINGSGKFSWSVGDQIAVYTTSGYKKSAALTSDRIEVIDGVSAATFSFSGDNYLEDADRTDVAVFPASLVFDGTAVRTGHNDAHTVGTGGSLKITLPGSYTLSQVSGTESPRPMIAVNSPKSGLAFNSICALLRITVKNIAWDAKSIKVTFPGKKVHGEFTLNSFEVGANGVTLSGSSDDGDDTITITDLGISEYTPELVINVPIPIGVASSQEYENVVVGVYDVSNLIINYISVPTKIVKPDSEDKDTWYTAWVPGRTAARKVTADLPVFTVGIEYKSAIIDAAARKMVVFAPGNLQAKLKDLPKPDGQKDGFSTDNFGAASEWRFAENQYTAIGDSKAPDRTYSYNSLRDPQVGDWIDLFAWMGNESSSAAILDDEFKYGIAIPQTSGTSNYFGSASEGSTELWFDWGNHEIGHDGKSGKYHINAWRTPSGPEIENIILHRKLNSKYLATATKATLTEDEEHLSPKASGLIILPDNYSHPYDVPDLKNVCSQSRYNKTTCPSPWMVTETYTPVGPQCSDNLFSLTEWKKLEDAGCVFLPFTNTRKLKSNFGTTSYPGDGWYWSSTTSSSSQGFALAFNDIAIGSSDYSSSRTNLQSQKSRGRALGSAVRLVRYIKP